jgi:hypothetical protein
MKSKRLPRISQLVWCSSIKRDFLVESKPSIRSFDHCLKVAIVHACASGPVMRETQASTGFAWYYGAATWQVANKAVRTSCRDEDLPVN